MKIPINIEYKEIPIEIKDREIVIDVPSIEEIVIDVPKTLDEKIIEKIPKVENGKEGKRGPKGEKGEKGEKGDQGDKMTFKDLTPYEIQVLTGAPGNPGEGVPRGGIPGDILTKKSTRNFDTEWTYNINDYTRKCEAIAYSIALG